MLYILLGIIAIGVLLASAEGKKLLNAIGTLALIGGVLYLGFWAVVICIGLFSQLSPDAVNTIQWLAFVFLVVPCFALLIYGILNKWYTLYKKGELKESLHRNYKKNWFSYWAIGLIIFALPAALLYSELVYGYIVEPTATSTAEVQNTETNPTTATDNNFSDNTPPSTNGTNPSTNTVAVSQISDSTYGLFIPRGNKSTCTWTYAGGSADIPYSQTTYANAGEQQTLTLWSGALEDGSIYDFKVSCVDDFGDLYTGVFPAGTP